MKNYMKYIFLIILVLVLVFIIVIFLKREKREESDFSIYFFNAGKADSMIIRNKDKTIMIDTGEELLNREILNYLNNNNITRLDYLIITHFDKDHVGSASTIINSITVDNVLQSNYPKDSIYYYNYINALNEKNINPVTVSGDYNFTLDDINVVVNGPDKKYDNNSSNNSSLIVSVNYKNNSFIFMGDAENARIKDFLSINDREYDFIKIPYHGHYQKRLNDLIDSIKPKYSVITSSLKEKEDDDTLELLKNKNVNNYLTREGAITITSDGNNIKINQ